MTVFNYFLKIAWQYRWSVISYTIIFFIFSLINSRQSVEESSFIDSELTIAVVLPAENSPLTEHLVKYLDDNNQVILSTDSENTLREKVYVGEIHAAIVIKEPIEKVLTATEAPFTVIANAQSSSAILLRVDLNQYLILAKALYAREQSIDLERFDKVLASKVEVKVVSNKQANSQQIYSTNWAGYYFKFVSYVLISILIVIIGYLISDFEDNGVRLRIYLGAMSVLKINSLKFVSSAVITLIISLIFILGALVIQPSLWYTANYLKHVGVVFISAVTILSLAYLSAILAGKNKTILGGMSVTLGLGLSFISGVMIPLQYLNENVQKIASLFPVYYITKAHEAIVSNQSYTQYLWILLLFAIFYFVLAVTISRMRQSVE